VSNSSLVVASHYAGFAASASDQMAGIPSAPDSIEDATVTGRASSLVCSWVRRRLATRRRRRSDPIASVRYQSRRAITDRRSRSVAAPHNVANRYVAQLPFCV
jgi:hypothetical protein